AGAPFQPGACPLLCGLPALLPSGGARCPGASRGSYDARQREGVSTDSGDGHVYARLGACHAGTGGGEDCPAPAGAGRFPGPGGSSRPARCLAHLAEAYGQVGQTEEGLTTLAEALATTHKTGDRYWEAALHRLKGELLLRQASPT